MGTQRIRAALSVLLVSFFLAGMTAPAQAQFGLAAGLNFESAEDINTKSTDATVKNSTGYHVGIVYDLGLGRLSIRPGLFYRRLGQTYKLPNSVANVAAWEIPVDLRFDLISTDFISPYLLAGPKASFLRSDLQEIDNELKNVSYSIALGIGVDVSLGSSLTLQPEFRYDYGATDYISKEITVNGTTFTQKDPTLSAFALRLNVLF